MATTPSFNKNGVKKRSWSKEEDDKLRSYIRRFGHWNWRLLPKFAGLSRSGKSCRLRWVNYLRPDIKHGNFTKEEEDIVMELHKKLGNKWSEMAAYLPGRSDNEIKNRWNTHLQKRIKKDQARVLETEQVGTIKPDQANSKQNHVQKSDLLTESPPSSSSTNLSACWFNGLDSAGSSDNAPKLDDYTPAENFWTDPFFSENDSIISSSHNLFTPSDLVYQTSFTDMIMSDDFLWASQNSYLQ